MSDSMRDEKARLRAHFKQLREQIAPKQRQKMDALVERHFFELPEVHDRHVFFTYLSRGGEVDTHGIAARLVQGHKRVLAPSPDRRALPADGMFNVSLHPAGGKLVESGRCGATNPEDLEVIVVPGIAWDRAGYRVGFGGGYFDRLLAAAPGALKVGLAYECQVVESVPRDGWDMAVDVVVTEAGAVRVVRDKL